MSKCHISSITIGINREQAHRWCCQLMLFVWANKVLAPIATARVLYVSSAKYKEIKV